MEGFQLIHSEGLTKVRVCSYLTRELGSKYFFDVYQLINNVRGSNEFDINSFFNNCHSELGRFLPETDRKQFDYQRIKFNFLKQSEIWIGEKEEQEPEALRFLFGVFNERIDPYSQFVVYLKLFLALDDELISKLFKISKDSIDTVVYQFSAELSTKKFPFVIPMRKSLEKKLNYLISQLNFLFQFIGDYEGLDKKSKVFVLNQVIATYDMIRETDRCNVPMIHSIISFSLFEYAQNEARFDPNGNSCQFVFQDRSKWNIEEIEWAWSFLASAGKEQGTITNYRLEALLLGLLMKGDSIGQVSWKDVYQVCEYLLEFAPSLNTQLIYAYSVGQLGSPNEAIDLIIDIDQLEEIKNYILIPFCLASFYKQLGDDATSKMFYEECFSISKSWKEKSFITEKYLN